MSSTWGNKIKISVFGQSHAEAIGVCIDGLPAGERVDREELGRFMQRRAPGRSNVSTPRREADEVKILCGLVNELTCGAPLAAIIENTNTRSKDYEFLKETPRPAHADYPAQVKYGGFQDVRGGGHFSGRLTAPLCIAGGICLQILARKGIEIAAHISSVGDVQDEGFDPMGLSRESLDRLRAADFPTLSAEKGEEMSALILAASAEGDSVGGTVECIVTGLPVGIGGPLFGGLDGKIASAIFGIPAVKGVEFGAGFGAAGMKGSENNDPYTVKDGKIQTLSNNAGGILGGISTGMPLLFKTAFKPTPSITKPQQSVRLSTLEETELRVVGRHDPCIVPRAVPVVEAVTAIALLDALLEN